MPNPPVTKIADPVQLVAQLERAYPGYIHSYFEVLSQEQVWGYLLTCNAKLEAFRCCYGQSGVWTVSPMYTM